ncbi:MAG: hypothetical protein HQL58_05610 [Magnetococcales bacterium]|nr:hypothetical protein [Magnetococcales bacterium]
MLNLLKQAVLLLSVLWSGIAGASDCRIGFDVGSSGIRVGVAGNPVSARASIDYLADVWPDNEINVTVEATMAALIQLPQTAALPEGCVKVAGGYSAWRLALERGNVTHLVGVLSEIHRRTGVALYVIPQDVEGSYGYHAAKQALGDRLHTPFVLDIGGGSLQIAGITGGWGTHLGQKTWRQLFCQQVKGSSDASCTTNPVGAKAQEQAATLLADELTAARKQLGSGLSLTAVSAPVVRSIHPVLQFLVNKGHIVADGVDAAGFSQSALAAAIAVLAPQDDGALDRLLDHCLEATQRPICSTRFIPVLVTDMLLVHALMRGLAVDRIEVAEADLTNVAGILADERALAWSSHYACYLRKLQQVGIDAFKADTRVCPP